MMLPPFAAAILLLDAAPPATVAPGAGPPAEQAAPADPPSDAPPPVVPTLAIESAPEIVVTGRDNSAPGDPLSGLNATSFEMVQAVDDAIIAPINDAYVSILPKPVRSGIHNFVTNLEQPIVFVNFLLQLKFGKAAETLGRFAINTTVGAAGLFDIAKRKPFNLPHRPNGLAYTLGYYGVGPGPYLYLPLIGATTVRDVVGRSLDLLLLPAAIGKPFNRPGYTTGRTVLSSLDARAELDAEFKQARASANPYATIRDYYLAKRQAEIDALRGKATTPPPATKDAPGRD